MKNNFFLSLRYLILFEGFFLSSISPIFFWFSYLILPFILFGFHFKYSVDKSCRILLGSYLLFILLVIITGTIGIDFFYPLKRSIEMLSCLICSLIIANSLRTVEHLRALLKGVVSSSVILTLILFLNNFNSQMMCFHFEDTGIGKNPSALYLFLGLSSCVFYSLIKKVNIVLLLLVSIFLFISILMTGSLKIVIPSIVIVVYFLYLSALTDKIVYIVFVGIGILLGYVYWNNILTFFESNFINALIDRILVLLGFEEYANTNLEFIEVRENLMHQAVLIFKEHSLYGIGLENTRLVMGTYSHNTFIEILCGGGVFLFLAFLFFLTKSFCELLKTPNISFRNFSLFLFLCLLFIANSMKIYCEQSCIIIFILLPSMVKLAFKVKTKKTTTKNEN